MRRLTAVCGRRRPGARNGPVPAILLVFLLSGGAAPAAAAPAPAPASADSCALLVPGPASQVRFREAGRRGWFAPGPMEALEPGDSVRVDAGYAIIHYRGGHHQRLTRGARLHVCPPGRRSLARRTADAVAGAFDAFMALARGDPGPPSVHRGPLGRRGPTGGDELLLLRLPELPRAWVVPFATPALRWVTTDSAASRAFFRVAVRPADSACRPTGPVVLDTVVQGPALSPPATARLQPDGTYRVDVRALAGPAADSGCVRVATRAESDAAAREAAAVRAAYHALDPGDRVTPEVLAAAALAELGWYHEALLLLDAVLARGAPHAAAEHLWDRVAAAGGLSPPPAPTEP